MDVLKGFVDQARARAGRLIFPEGDEERTLKAAERLVREQICRVVVSGTNERAVRQTAEKSGISLEGIDIMIPDRLVLEKETARSFEKKMLARGIAPADVAGMFNDPLYFGALYLRSGDADALVTGARADTADVLKAAFHCVGPREGIKIVSSFFIMVPPADHPIASEPVLFADCAVNPDPGAQALADIAASSVHTFRNLFPGRPARVAFLSFSTKGSAAHRSVDKVVDAMKAARGIFEGDPEVFIDGELQFDAASVAAVGSRKAPHSPVAGQANIFIFPDLNSGNIGYKIAERYGRFSAIGPILQGLAAPMSDLSRGCTPDDIYHVAAITLALSSKT